MTAGPSLGHVADRLDVVAVRVPYERAVVVLVILGPEAWCVKHLGAGGDRGVEEGAHGGSVRCGEGDV